MYHFGRAQGGASKGSQRMMSEQTNATEGTCVIVGSVPTAFLIPGVDGTLNH